jgi:hypothetical protein
MHGGIQSRKLQRDMTPRDAVVSFQCFPPNLVQVSEKTCEGGIVRHEPVQRHSATVGEMEEKRIFFATQTDVARKRVMNGQSCAFNVYFREP